MFSGANTIAGKGHTFGPWLETTKATCEVDGVSTRICSACQVKETTKIDKLGHNWGEWKVVVKANCETKGSEKHVCGTCKAEETRDTAKTGLKHVWFVHESIRPTCTNKGYDIYKCFNCDTTEERNFEPSYHKIFELDRSKVTGFHNQDFYDKYRTAKGDPDPKCGVAGKLAITCKFCDTTWKVDADPLDHVYPNQTWAKKFADIVIILPLAHYAEIEMDSGVSKTPTINFYCRVTRLPANCYAGENYTIWCGRGCGATKVLINPAAAAPVGAHVWDTVKVEYEDDLVTVKYRLEKCTNLGCPATREYFKDK